MSRVPVLEQIRVYSEALVDDLPDASIQPVPTVVPTPLVPRHGGSRHRSVWAIAAALVVVLAIGIPLLVRGAEAPPVTEPDPTPTTTPVSPPTTATTTTEAAPEPTAGAHQPSDTLAPIPTESFGDIVWVRYDPAGEPASLHPELFLDPNGGYALLWPGDEGFVNGDVWYSAEGVSWVDHPDPEPWRRLDIHSCSTGSTVTGDSSCVASRDETLPEIPRDPDATVVRLPEGGFAAYLFGSENGPTGEDIAKGDEKSFFRSAEVLTSPDGIEWTSRGTPGFIDGDNLGYYDNVLFEFTSATEGLFLRIFEAGPEGSLPEEDGDGQQFWGSPDGLTWTRGVMPSAESRTQVPGAFRIETCDDPMWDMLGWQCDPEHFSGTNVEVSRISDAHIIGFRSWVDGRPRIALSVDGDIWETIEGPPPYTGSSWLRRPPKAVGDVIFWSYFSPGQTVVWMAKVDHSD